MKKKKLNVVLDLDNTLIYSYELKRVKNKDFVLKNFDTHEMDDEYLVCERPGLTDFLDWLFKNFNVMVWSAASPDYVQFIVNKIIKGEDKKDADWIAKHRNIQRVFTSDHCDESSEKFDGDLKNLNLLWDKYDLENYGPYNTVIVDDLKHIHDIQPHNTIRIKKFIANEKHAKDNELEEVKKKLIDMKTKFEKESHKTPDYVLV